MATATTNAYCDGSSLTNFNAWAYWMYQQFLAFGWTQTGDSGQGTFPASGSVPSSAGSYYAIFQSADGLSAATKITVKLEMWADGSSVPNFGLTVGTNGTDGAGNMLTPYTTRLYGGGSNSFKAYSANASDLLPCYASGDSGSIRFVMWNNGSGSPDYYNITYIFIARSRDGSGNATSNYVQLWAGNGQAAKFFQTVLGNNGGANQLDNSGYVMAAYPSVSGSASWSSGGAILASPVLQNIGGLSNPTPDILVGSNKDFVPGATASITVYGVAHTYLAMGSSQAYAWVNGPQSSLLVRYE